MTQPKASLSGSDTASEDKLALAKHAIAVAKSPVLAARPVRDSGATGRGFGGSDSTPPEARSIAPDEGKTAATPIVLAEQDGDTLTVTRAELAALTAKGVSQAIDRAHESLIAQQQATVEQLTAVQQRADADRAALQSEADRSASEVERLKSILHATGNSIPSGGGVATSDKYGPSINVLNFPSSKEPQGCFKDWVGMLNNPQYCPRISHYDAQDGAVIQRNTTAADMQLRDPKYRVEVIRGLDLYGKSHGLLRGMGRDATPGPTRNAEGSIPEHFLDVISGLMRTSNIHRYVFHQFPVIKIDVGLLPGQTALVSRFDWLDAPENLDDFILDDGTNLVEFNTASQSLRSSTVGLTIKKYGIGRGTTIANRVVSFMDLVVQSRMEELLAIGQERLYNNYLAVQDMAIRKQFMRAAVPENTFYNDAGSLSQDPLTILAGNDGTMSLNILSQLSAEMTTAAIPTFNNGKRVGVLHPLAVAQLRNSMGDMLSASTAQEIETITNVLNAGTLGDGLQMPSGYIGTFNGFMLFESSDLSIGQVGSEGVSSIATGAGSRTFRTSIFFGPGAVGYAQASPFEVIEDSAGYFRTRRNLIWQMNGQWGALDCSAHLGDGQQTRVRILRTSDQTI